MEIAQAVYSATAGFPPEQKFTLTSQLQRSAISIPSNVAEGFARRHTREFIQFCHIALGSCAELETQLILAHHLRFLSDETRDRLEELLDHEGRMLNRLIQSLTRGDHRAPSHEPRVTSHGPQATDKQQCPLLQ